MSVPAPMVERAPTVPGASPPPPVTCRRWPEATYYLAAPAQPTPRAPVLVSVHGISRNAHEHAATFAAACSQLGWFVVAPLFSEAAFPRYQQLGFSERQRGPRADLALNAILDEIGRSTGARTGQVFLFGYSGGGQFAHRYAMLHPQRVLAIALGAPGWYTFPDAQESYPRGVADIGRRLAAEVNLDAFLRLPTSVMVGSEDHERDPSFNASRRIDRQQGLTRVDRGQRWIEALGRAAAARGLQTRHENLVMPGCGHSFAECMERGRMDLRALDFFIRTQRGGCLAPGRGKSAPHGLSHAAFVR